jgi:hypothetical protein
MSSATIAMPFLRPNAIPSATALATVSRVFPLGSINWPYRPMISSAFTRSAVLVGSSGMAPLCAENGPVSSGTWRRLIQTAPLTSAAPRRSLAWRVFNLLTTNVNRSGRDNCPHEAMVRRKRSPHFSTAHEAYIRDPARSRCSSCHSMHWQVSFAACR